MNFEQIDNGVYQVWKKTCKLKYINPTNQKIEKKRFLASSKYNPKFEYRKLDFNSINMKKKLLSYKKELKNYKDNNIAILLSKKIDKLLIWLSMLESRGTKNFTKYSLQYYGKPKRDLVAKAKNLVKIKEKKLSATVSSRDVVLYVKKKIKSMKIDWKVKEKANIGARADCVTSEKTIYIKKGELFPKNELKKLVVHELGVHATRALNAKKQKYKIFLMGTANYEPTEEGLATIMEEKNNVLTKRTLKSYAGRVIAIGLSLRKSFREVYNYLLKYFPYNQAYQLTMRAKRGLTNTAKPGAFTKDYIYLYGREKLKKVKNIKPLFVGRIGIDDLPYLK